MQDQSRAIVWLEQLEQLTLELSPILQPTTAVQDLSKKGQCIDEPLPALSSSWNLSQLGFVKVKEEPDNSVQEGLGRQWVRGPLGFKLCIREE